MNKRYVIDIEKRMTNIHTFTVEADDYVSAQEKAMEKAIDFEWPDPDHEEMAIMYTETEEAHWNGKNEGSLAEDTRKEG
jgi:hypothetical protein